MLFLELRPPDVVELVEFLRDEIRRSRANGRAAIRTRPCCTSSRAPCTASRWTKRATRCAAPWLANRAFGPESLPALLEEKRLLVNRSGVIEYVADGTNLGDVGGLEGLKKWLLERRKLFQMRDSLSDEIVPKGLLMMGIPGCGKSLSVKAIASCFQLPLYRVDMIEIFSGRHGKPEGAFVEACRMMEEMAPAVLWFDEIEMGITLDGIGRRAGPNLRLLPHLDAGEDARAVRGRHRQPDRPAARGDDPQGALRRSVLRGPAARRRTDRDLQDPPEPPRRGCSRDSTSAN